MRTRKARCPWPLYIYACLPGAVAGGWIAAASRPPTTHPGQNSEKGGSTLLLFASELRHAVLPLAPLAETINACALVARARDASAAMRATASFAADEAEHVRTSISFNLHRRE